MEDGKTEPPGPDLTQGIASSDLPDGGKLLGHVGDEQVLARAPGSGNLRDRRCLHPL